MNMQDQDFWKTLQGAAPGMLQTGLGIYEQRQGAKGNAELLSRAQGPLYQQSMSASQRALANAGSMDPKAAAQERFNAQQQLLSGKDAADEQQMLRMLHAKGMLGAASYNPGVEGINQSAVAMNPQMAAFYAARNARNSRAAYDALNEGEQQIDRQINRSGQLASQAGNVQNAGITAQSTQVNPRAGRVGIAQGAFKIAKDLGILDDIGRGGVGMLRSGIDWLGNTTGWWGQGQATPQYGLDDLWNA